MTARMGLTTRLALARTLVFTGLQADPKALADLVRRLCRQRADLIVISQPDAIADDLLTGYRAGLQALDARAILGISAAPGLVAESSADLAVFTDAGSRPVAGHAFGLVVAFVGDDKALTQALDDPAISAVVVPPRLVRQAALLAPAAKTTSKPWFAAVTSPQSGRTAIQTGARRLAFDCPADAQLGPYRELLSGPWMNQMNTVGLAAFGEQ